MDDSPHAEQAVYIIRHGQLVARDHARGEDHRVTRTNLDLGMFAPCDPREGAERLTLAAGG